MAFVSKSVSRVGTSKPRNASRNALSNPWRLAFKALTGGLWVVAASLLAVTTLLLGTGWPVSYTHLTLPTIYSV